MTMKRSTEMAIPTLNGYHQMTTVVGDCPQGFVAVSNL
jgi:hypothetical protein